MANRFRRRGTPDVGPDALAIGSSTCLRNVGKRERRDLCLDAGLTEYRDGLEIQIDAGEEIKMLRKYNTITVVNEDDLPEGANVLPTQFILKIKRDENADVDKYKVRFVAGGHKQIYGLDYEQTNSPVAHMSSHRCNLAYAAQKGWVTGQVDVKSAYLNATMTEKVYIRLPSGYLPEGTKGKVGLLNKALYGTKQAGREWYHELKGTMTKELGFTCAHADRGVYFYHDEVKDEHIIIAVATDDMNMIANHQKVMDLFKTNISKYYEITDLGETHYLLGFEIQRNLSMRTISINQSAYIDTIADRFNLSSARPIYLPMEPGTEFSKYQCPSTPKEFDRMRNIPYRQALGAAWYCATVSRPDVSFALSVLAQFSDNPAEAHWRALQRVIVYLKTTRDLWLTLGGNPDGFHGYTDSDWATQPGRHSHSGFSFLVGSGAISWSSKKQTLIALSSTEAEYIGETHAAREAIWLRQYWSEVTGTPLSIPTIIHSDNQGAIALAMNEQYHARTKHIDIRYHFIRETIERSEVRLIYCPTDDMTADIFTKALPRQKFDKFRKLLGLRAA